MTHPAPQRRLPYTYREYALLPEDGKRHELIEGDFYVSPAPSPWHQTVSRRLQFALMQALEMPGLAQIFDAPIDLILDDETVVQPDLVIVGRDREHRISRRGIEGAPHLVVEILSPGTGERDQVLKRRVYERFAIPEYWVVDPAACTVTVWRLEGGVYVRRAELDRAATLTAADFPAVVIPLEAVFR